MDLPRFASTGDLSFNLSPRPQSARVESTVSRPKPHRPKPTPSNKVSTSVDENTSADPNQMQVSATADYSLRQTVEIMPAKVTRSLSVGDGLRPLAPPSSLSEDNLLPLKLETLPNSSPKAISGLQVRSFCF